MPDAGTLTDDVLAAFRGQPRQVTIAKGTRLYRFVTESVNNITESPWWFDATTFSAVLRLATATGVSLPDAARARLAVTTEWNPAMSALCVVGLNRVVDAWQGVTRHQPFTQASRDVLLIGGVEQLYVPGLAPADVSVLFFGPADRL